ncbi:MAG: SAM-dependent methyltransferase [Spirosomataceae bacterium]|jgi:SAM-dependent methyltransferase
MMKKCILCKSEDVATTEKLIVEELKKVYFNDTGLTIPYNSDTIDVRYCRNCTLIFFDPFFPGDGNFYSYLQNLPNYYETDKEEFVVASKYISNSSSVLEVGCGEGHFKKYLDESVKYTGLDFNPTAIEKAQKKGIRVIDESIEKHAESYQLEYDCVLFFQLLEHIDNPHSFLLSVLKCLKPGGILIFAVPNNESFLVNAINHSLNLPPHHCTKWNKVTFEKVAKIFNLETVKIVEEGLPKYHFRYFYKIMVNTRLRMLLNLPHREIDLSALSVFLLKLSGLISYLITTFKSFKSNELGQSITTIYKKK